MRRLENTLKINTPIAKNNLGAMYMNGNIGCLKNDKPNYEEARKYFEESNTRFAKCGLGAMYVAGAIGRLPNGKPDYEATIIYFTDAQLSGLHAAEKLLRDLIQLVDQEEKLHSTTTRGH
jgi:TPR repeat protein